MSNDNDIKDWYDIINKKNKIEQIKPDINFNKHYILPCSMILMLGGTGTGKSTVVCDFLLDRKNKSFYEVIIFNPVNTDEPIYNFLYKINPNINIIDDINELPDLKDFENSKTQEKLLIVDDFINLNKTDMKKIERYLISSRKFGFTVLLMAQNYTSVPKIITRNISYFIVFKLNDNVSINTIIKNHNIYNINKDYIIQCYLKATEKKKNFFMFDCNINSDKEHCLRHNFIEFYAIPDKKDKINEINK
jgi:hypothetical protein